MNESSDRSKRIFKAIHDGLVVLGPGQDSGRQAIVAMNPAAAELTGCVAESAVGREVDAALPWLIEAGLSEILGRVMETGREERLLAVPGGPSSHAGWLECRVISLPLGETLLILADVTRQVLSLESQERHQHLLEQLFDTTHCLFAYLDREFNFRRVNRAYADSGRHPPDYYVGRNHFDLYPHDENEGIFREVVETGRPYTVEAKPFSYPDQPERDVTYWDWSLHPVFDSNKRVDGLILCLVDVTRRIRTEIGLQESDAWYRRLVDTVLEGVWLVDIQGNTTYANQAMAGMLGYSVEEMVGRSFFEFMDSKARREARSLIERRRPGVVQRFEFRLRRKDGSDLWAIVSTNPVFSESSGFNGTLGLVTDITTRKKALDLLNRKTTELRCLFEISTIMAEDSLSLEEIIIRTLKLIPAAWPYPEITRVRLKLEDRAFQSPGFQKTSWRLAADVIADSKRVGVLEVCYLQRKPDRDYSPFQTEEKDLLVAIAERLGKAIERQRAAEALRESEEKSRTLLNATRDAVALIDRQGRFRAVNETFARWLNRPVDDLVGLGLYEVMSQDLVDRRLARLDLMFESGQPVQFQDEEDGRFLDIYLYPVKDHLGRTQMGAVFTRDVTARTKAQQEVQVYQDKLRALTAELSVAEEKERRRLAVDLHDSVGQLLAAAQIKAAGLRMRLNDSELADELDDVLSLIDLASAETRSLTCEIHPPSLYDLGLEVALDEFLEHIGHEHHLAVRLEDDGQPKPMDQDAKTAVFRIVRELIFNVVKHAKARELTVSLKRVNGRLWVEVADDGVGLDTTQMYRPDPKKKSFGLLSVKERLAYLGGELKIYSSLNQGTKVVVQAPLTPGGRAPNGPQNPAPGDSTAG